MRGSRSYRFLPIALRLGRSAWLENARSLRRSQCVARVERAGSDPQATARSTGEIGVQDTGPELLAHTQVLQDTWRPQTEICSESTKSRIEEGERTSSFTSQPWLRTGCTSRRRG